MDVVFSDLDGTLIDRSRYDCDEAIPAIELLRRLRVPLVFVTSKTRGEVEFWRNRLCTPDPFVVENGGAVYIPRGYFPFPVPGASARNGYDVVELGAPYPRLVEALRAASLATRVPVRGFHEMTVEEVTSQCGLSHEQARLAQDREYDEPFLIEDPDRTPLLLAAIEALGFRFHAGGRFYHITGRNDKALAVDILIGLYKRAYGEVRSIGLGDAPNDVPFLERVGRAFVVASDAAPELRRALPHATLTRHPGPAGWREAIFANYGGRLHNLETPRDRTLGGSGEPAAVLPNYSSAPKRGNFEVM